MLGRIHEMKGNFEHLAHEHWPRTSGRIVLKFYKKQAKSKNHKICHGIMISYAEAKVKNWEGLKQVITYTPQKSKNIRRRSKELRSSHLDFMSKWRSNWCMTSKRFVHTKHNLDSFLEKLPVMHYCDIWNACDDYYDIYELLVLIWVPYTWENKKTDEILTFRRVQWPRRTTKKPFELALNQSLPCAVAIAHGKGVVTVSFNNLSIAKSPITLMLEPLNLISATKITKSI